MSKLLNVFLVALLVLLSGCQQKMKPNPEYRLVKGTVTLNGEPVGGATVLFFPLESSGLSAGGHTNTQGGFVLTADGTGVFGAGTKPGKYKVTVQKVEMPVNQDQLDFEGGKISQNELMSRQTNRRPPQPKHLLPEIYSTPNRTPLEFSVEDTKVNICDLKLEGK